MSEIRKEFRERIGRTYLDGHYGPEHLVTPDEDQIDGAEAVYAQALRDVAESADSFTFQHEGQDCIDLWLSIRDFAAERGIDLTEAN